jgi:hypothetical protein
MFEQKVYDVRAVRRSTAGAGGQVSSVGNAGTLQAQR